MQPAEVRLRPKPGDGYRWVVTRPAARLFRKNLSKLSVGVYSRLMKEVGRKFRAVSVETQARGSSSGGYRGGTEGNEGGDEGALGPEPTVVEVLEEGVGGKVESPASSSEDAPPPPPTDWKAVAEREVKAREAAERECLSYLCMLYIGLPTCHVSCRISSIWIFIHVSIILFPMPFTRDKEARSSSVLRNDAVSHFSLGPMIGSIESIFFLAGGACHSARCLSDRTLFMWFSI